MALLISTAFWAWLWGPVGILLAIPLTVCLGVLGTQVYLDTYATIGIRPTIAREVQAAFSTARVESLLAQPAVRWIVAECEAHLIGFTQLTLGPGQPDAIHGGTDMTTNAPASLRRASTASACARSARGWNHAADPLRVQRDEDKSIDLEPGSQPASTRQQTHGSARDVDA